MARVLALVAVFIAMLTIPTLVKAKGIRFCGRLIPAHATKISCNRGNTNLGPLVRFPKLTYLRLHRLHTLMFKPISLAVLGQLRNLRTLMLHWRRSLPPPDLRPLGKLKQLEKLVLTETRDLKPLAHLQALRDLDLGWTDKLRNWKILRKFKKLTALLFKGKISDVVTLSKLTQLRELHLYKTHLKTLRPLSRQTNLRILKIEGSVLPRKKRIKHLGVLSKMTKLRELMLVDLNIQNLAPLRRMKSLRELMVSGNRGLRSIAPLSKLKLLETLTISHTRVRSLRPLRHARQLYHLVIHNTPVRDMNVLLRFKKLYDVSLCRNRLAPALRKRLKNVIIIDVRCSR